MGIPPPPPPMSKCFQINRATSTHYVIRAQSRTLFAEIHLLSRISRNHLEILFSSWKSLKSRTLSSESFWFILEVLFSPGNLIHFLQNSLFQKSLSSPGNLVCFLTELYSLSTQPLRKSLWFIHRAQLLSTRSSTPMCCLETGSSYLVAHVIIWQRPPVVCIWLISWQNFDVYHMNYLKCFVTQKKQLKYVFIARK